MIRPILISTNMIYNCLNEKLKFKMGIHSSTMLCELRSEEYLKSHYKNNNDKNLNINQTNDTNKTNFLNKIIILDELEKNNHKDETHKLSKYYNRKI